MASNSCAVYFGTYTSSGKSKGIYTCRLDTSTGMLSTPELAVETANPSFLAIHPDHRHLYAVGESGVLGDGKTDTVSAFSIDQVTGKQTLLNRQSTGGLGPCHVNVDLTGKCVLVANYNSGSCASLPVRDDGALGEIGSFIQHEGSSVNPERQTGPHAHSVNLSPGNVVVFSVNPKTGKLKTTGQIVEVGAPVCVKFISAKEGQEFGKLAHCNMTPTTGSDQVSAC